MGTLSPEPPIPVGSSCAGRLGFPDVPLLLFSDSTTAADVGDATGDGKPDLLVMVGSSLRLAVGAGDGTYDVQAPIASLLNMQSPRLADVNGDGSLDIVFGSSNITTNVYVMLNNGVGVFGTAQALNAGSYTDQIDVRDLNNDGRRDIIVFSRQGRAINVLLNSASGFGSAITYSFGNGFEATYMAVGDVSGDNSPDVVASRLDGTVSVILNNGAGAFGAATSLVASTTTAERVALEDLDEDGLLDIVVGTVININYGYVSVLLNQGNNTFAAHVDYPTNLGYGARAMATGDVNGDGHIDVVVGSPHSNDVDLLLGTGTGTFGSPASLANDTSQSILLADVNSDGKLDLITAGSFTARTYLNHGGSSPYEQRRRIAYPDQYLRGVRMIDVNSDNVDDLVVVDHSSTGIAPNGFVRMNVGTSNWFSATTVTTPLAFYPETLGTADFDNDGRSDLILLDGVSAQIAMNNGNGTFTTTASFAVPYYTRHAIAGDFDSDGYRDLVVGTYDGLSTSQVLFFHGHGNGTFAAPTTLWTNMRVSGLGSGDLNNDGKPDLLVSYVGTQSAGIDVLLGSGNGTFVTSSFIPLIRAVPKGMLVHDFNGDGNPDVLEYGSDRVAVMVGDGNGGLSPTAGTITWAANDVAVADLDADNKLDVIASAFDAPTVALLLGQGDATFATPVYFEAGRAPRSPTIADVNHDGRLDVVLHGSADVSVLLGRCL